MIAADGVSAIPLKISDLRHSFGTRKALDGLNLQVEPGGICGIVGPDGAGKTTALRICSGLIDPVSGSVTVFGMDPRSAQARDFVGYMPQMYSLYGDLSVIENLKFFGKMFCLDKNTFNERAQRLLSITMLKEFVDRRADALSGGMYKKLALAAVLISRPRLLLLDEPTNGVDPVSRAELWDLLYEFVSEGSTVVVSTAYMDEAARCSKVGLLSEGRLIAEGSPHDLRNRFSGTVFYLAETEGHSTGAHFHSLIDSMRPGIQAVTPSGNGFRVLASSAQVGSVRNQIVNAGMVAGEVSPSFEDIFISSFLENSDG